MRARLSAIVLALALTGACGGGGDADPDGGIDVSGLTYSPCDPASYLGGFEIELADSFTSVQGRVLDGVIPSTVLDTVETSGSCRLARAPSLFCDPACEAGDTCAAGGTCVPYPTGQDVGTVTVRGLAADVAMEPTPPGSFYSFTGTLPHPGFAPGAGLQLDAAGGTVAAFTLLGWGITPLAVAEEPVPVESGSPVALAWDPPPEAGPARVSIVLNVNLHGVTGSRIECLADDTGSFEIPAPLVTALLDDGLSGFPTVVIVRSSVDSASIEGGCVELRVKSEVTLPVDIPGLVSCDGDEDCTLPETCQGDLTCG